MLERANKKIDWGGWKSSEDFYAANVPAELLGLSMDDVVQAEIASVLAERVGEECDRCILLWLMGKIKPSVGIVPLSRVICSGYRSWPNSVLAQAHYSLQNMFFGGESVSAELDADTRRELAVFVARDVRSSDDHLREAAEMTKGRLEIFGIPVE